MQYTCIYQYVRGESEKMIGKIILETHNISKSFGVVKALSDVSITLHEGELLSVMGENGAGKSTLMNVITGIYKADAGEIYVDGKKVLINSPLDAINAGISIVHQELVNCPNVTVAENIFMSSIISSKGSFVHYSELNRKAAELLKNFDTDIRPEEKMQSLPVSKQQIVEIAKALSTNAKIIIFDEPTSSLADDEVQKLFEIIKRLKENGIGILYISHRMSEIMELSERVTVLKDGCYVDTIGIESLNQELLVEKMTGRALDKYCPPKSDKIGETIFEAKHVTGKKMFHDVSFELKKGEILGFSGLVGSGRSEVMKAIVGLEEKEAGEICLYGEKKQFRNYGQALKDGVIYLTEDRKIEGLFLQMSVQKNMSILNLPIISGKFFVDADKESTEADKYSKMMNVKCSGLNQLAGKLSGGNQQKILIGNALSVSPKIIILDEPTKGIDVGAKAEIYQKLRDLSAQGVGIIVISSDLTEIIGLCDRVCVMYEGKLMGQVSGDDINEQEILQLASGL